MKELSKSDWAQLIGLAIILAVIVNIVKNMIL